jgi:hypothetical protein
VTHTTGGFHQHSCADVRLPVAASLAALAAKLFRRRACIALVHRMPTRRTRGHALAFFLLFPTGGEEAACTPRCGARVCAGKGPQVGVRGDAKPSIACHDSECDCDTGKSRALSTGLRRSSTSTPGGRSPLSTAVSHSMLAPPHHGARFPLALCRLHRL